MEPSEHTALTQGARPPRKQKLTALLDRRRRVIAEGVDSTMDAFLTAIRELLRRGMVAKKQGIELPTFLRILNDQAGR